MITYVDASTMMKLIVSEPGSQAAADIWDGADVLASARILYVEAQAALAAAHRAGRLTLSQHRRAAVDFEDLWSQLVVIEIDRELVRHAAELADRRGLRGYDAVHLAAALRVGAEILTSADRLLCQAALAEGFHVADPTRTAEPS